MSTVQLEIKGKVQGVFFRANAKRRAEELDLTGWIKNKSNGDVEAVVSGKTGSVEDFISWCKDGYERAIVTEVNVAKIEESVFQNFSIRR